MAAPWRTVLDAHPRGARRRPETRRDPDTALIRERAERLARVAGALAWQHLPRINEGQVLYNSFNGRFSDSPRAIYEELASRGEEREHVWISGESAPPLPDGVESVSLYSPRYFRAVGHSEYVVSNRQMPTNFRKKQGVTYLQTWHGTPLKRIGYDNERWADDPAGLRKTARDFARWDYLVSQNSFSTEIFRRAFRFEGEILETGYPRNDILSSPKSEEMRRRVRRALGIEEGAVVVLYAPTFRDNLVEQKGTAGFSLALDMDRVAATLGEDHVLLLRLHYMVARSLGNAHEGLMRDVSGHPDIRELYLAADVLLTDYSSAMFDFAVTGKPILFFTYDLADYRDDMRGFYFDLEEEAPGPVCHTTDEVLEALAELPRVTDSFVDRYLRFKQRFCPLDDGHATKRVVDRVFAKA